MKKIIMILAIIVIQNIFSQDNNNNQDKENIVLDNNRTFLLNRDQIIGGNFAVGIGNYFQFNITPFYAIEVLPNVYAGGGFDFYYLSSSYYNYKEYMLGPTAVYRYVPFENIFFDAKFTYINSKVNDKRRFVPDARFGIGYKSEGDSYLEIKIMYEFIHNPYNPFVSNIAYNSNLFLSTGFVISL